MERLSDQQALRLRRQAEPDDPLVRRYQNIGWWEQQAAILRTRLSEEGRWADTDAREVSR